MTNTLLMTKGADKSDFSFFSELNHSPLNHIFVEIALSLIEFYSENTCSLMFTYLF